MWIKYGKHDIGMWINPEDVSYVRGIGTMGIRGCIIGFTNGHTMRTRYPTTQLVAMLDLTKPKN